MAGSKSDYLENALLDGVLGGGTWSKPGTVYLGLWTSALTDASTGASSGEVSGGSYARKSITNNATEWPNASGGSKSNANSQSFAQATASWGTVTHFAILDSATLGAGNIMYWADLTTSKTIGSGDTATFAAGSITVSEA